MSLFVIAVFFGSGLSVLKILALTNILPAEELGALLTTLALVQFSSIIINFGLSESTFKDFPKKAINRDFREIRTRLQDIFSIAISRILLLLCCGLTLSASKLLEVKPEVVILFCILSLLGTLSLCVASLIRALHDAALQSSVPLFRGFISLTIVCLTSIFFKNLESLLIAEVFSNILLITLTLILTKKKFQFQFLQFREIKFIPIRIRDHSRFNEDGKRVFLSTLFSSALLTLDKPAVSLVYGLETGGKYAAITVIYQIVSTFINSITQRIGVSFISLQNQICGNKKQIEFLLKGIGAHSFFTVLIFIYIYIYRDFLLSLSENYILLKQDTLLSLYSVYIFLSFYTLLDFLLLARNIEKGMLVSSLFAATSFLFFTSACFAFNLTLVYFFYILIASRAAQIIFQIFFLNKFTPKEK